MTRGKKSEQFSEKVRERSLQERNRLALAYLELSKDKTFQKLAEDYKQQLIEEVLTLGDEVAHSLVAEYGTRDPRRIAAELGVKVFGEDKGRARRSEYRRERREIVVYRDHHEKMLRYVRSSELSEHLLKFMVAHELFKHLEFQEIGPVYKRYKFKAWQLGPYVKERYIEALSKVAAQAFTQTLLKLEISPQVFDYLTYILFTNN